MIDISVIIPTHNAVHDLLNCLRSLERSNFEPSRFEVIIVDDGSTDRTESAIRQFASTSKMQIVYVKRDRSRGFGPGCARNDGLDIARGKVAAFTDADCLVDRGWLTAIDRAILTEGCGLAWGDITCDEVLLFPWKLSPAGQRGVTANLAVDLRLAGHTRFAEEFIGLIGNDTDYRRRLVVAGLAYRYVPSMVVDHPARRMTIGQVIRRSIWRKNEVLFFKRHGRVALKSMHPLFRPYLLGHLSPFALVSVGCLVAIAVWADVSWLLPALVSVALLYLLFLVRLYRLCIIYRPVGGVSGVSWPERHRTFVSLVVYLPCVLWARLVGSIRYRHIMI